MRRIFATALSGPLHPAPVCLRAAVLALCALLTPPAFALSLASIESEVSAEPPALLARVVRTHSPASGNRTAPPRDESPRPHAAALGARRAVLRPGHVLDNGDRAPLRC